MSAAPAVALAFAAMGAAGYGFASVLQSIGAHRGAGTLRTLRDPLYLTGVSLDLAAWVASLVALRTLPVYQVQAVLAGSLAVTVIAARLLLAVRLRRVDAAAAAVTVGALAALAVCSGPQRPVHLPGAVGFAAAVAAVGVAAAGWGVARAVWPQASAALAGLAFGGTALCARALTVPARPLANPPEALRAVATDPLALALVVFGITGMVLYAHALEHGQVGPVTALLWIVEVVVPSVAGVTLLGDTVRPGWAPAAVVAVTVTVAAATVLATAPAQDAIAPVAAER